MERRHLLRPESLPLSSGSHSRTPSPGYTHPSPHPYPITRGKSLDGHGFRALLSGHGRDPGHMVEVPRQRSVKRCCLLRHKLARLFWKDKSHDREAASEGAAAVVSSAVFVQLLNHYA